MADAATFAMSSVVLACPSCPTSDRVRCIVFDNDFWTNLGTGVLPFGVILAVSALVHRLGSSALRTESLPHTPPSAGGRDG